MVTSIGVDVSKSSLAVAFKRSDNTFCHKEFSNSKDGINNFLEKLQEENVKHDTPIVMESTGSFHLPLAMTLKDSHQYGAVKVINGILTKRFHQSKIRQTKNDNIDSEILANMPFFENLDNFKQEEIDVMQRKRISMLKKLIKIRQQLRQMTNSQRESLEKLDQDTEILQGNEEILKGIEKQISIIENEIMENEQSELVEKLSQIPGVSQKNAAILVAFLRGYNFTNANKLVAFLGLDLKVKESGTSIKGRRRLSKRGNPFLRHVLFKTAWGLKQYNPKYKEYYEKKRAEGHHYYTNMLATARKFLREFLSIAKEIEFFS